MATIIKERATVTEVTRSHQFSVKEVPGYGYGFIVDENDQPIIPPEARINWEHCVAGMNDRGETIIDNGIVEHGHTYREAAVLECDCGGKVTLSSSDTNYCKSCDRMYNLFGQRVTGPLSDLYECEDY